MGEAGFILETILAALLGFTMLHAIRLHRSLERLRQDRSALEAATLAFDEGMRAAQHALRQASEQLAGPLANAGSLRDDLAFLSERGDTLADRLDALVRAARPLAQAAPAAEPARSQAERELLLALQARS